MIKFYSLNVRGLRDQRKRREIFCFLKRKEYDVIFLQEGHNTHEIENTWAGEWGGEITFSHFTSKARGVLTLFRKGIELLNHWSDDQGRLNINEIRINELKYTCINIYAPNIESEKSNVFNEISTVYTTNFKCAGLELNRFLAVPAGHRGEKSRCPAQNPGAQIYNGVRT